MHISKGGEIKIEDEAHLPSWSQVCLQAKVKERREGRPAIQGWGCCISAVSPNPPAPNSLSPLGDNQQSVTINQKREWRGSRSSSGGENQPFSSMFLLFFFIAYPQKQRLTWALIYWVINTVLLSYRMNIKRTHVSSHYEEDKDDLVSHFCFDLM